MNAEQEEEMKRLASDPRRDPDRLATLAIASLAEAMYLRAELGRLRAGSPCPECGRISLEEVQGARFCRPCHRFY